MAKYVLAGSQFCMVLFLATIINVHGQQTQASLTDGAPMTPVDDPVACKTKKSAPPVSLYVWPPDTTIQVYFMRGLFTTEQRQTLVAAMKDWNHGARQIGAGVSFKDAGETDRRVNCKQCLTIARKDPKVKVNHFYALFYPVDYERNGWLNSAWIEFSPATTDPKALQGYMAHELGHSLGLDNCPSCGDRKSIMNSFRSVNRHNGLLSPSHCDLEVVRKVYDGHRKLAATSSQMPDDTPLVIPEP